ncbi:MAG: hypothetical protein VKL42_13665 [Snowella sp.]|nr:hypothetical protein [Snowella sp.]
MDRTITSFAPNSISSLETGSGLIDVTIGKFITQNSLYWGFTVKTDLSTSNPPAGEAQLITNIDQALTLLQNNVGFQVAFDQSLIPEMAESLSPLQQIAEAIADYVTVKNRYTHAKKIPL